MAGYIADIIMKQNDLRPYVDHILTDADGAVDLTDGTVKFIAIDDDGEEAVNATTDTGVSILDTTAGSVRYQWQDGDTSTSCRLRGEWQVTYPSDEPVTFPNSGFISILITPEGGS